MLAIPKQFLTILSASFFLSNVRIIIRSDDIISFILSVIGSIEYKQISEERWLRERIKMDDSGCYSKLVRKQEWAYNSKAKILVEWSTWRPLPTQCSLWDWDSYSEATPKGTQELGYFPLASGHCVGCLWGAGITSYETPFLGGIQRWAMGSRTTNSQEKERLSPKGVVWASHCHLL